MFSDAVITSDTHKDIENHLEGFGLFFRCFSRAKERHSLNKKIQKKIESKEYTKHGKMLQDAIGVRVILYFPEDIESVIYLLDKKFTKHDEMIDPPCEQEFSPTRCNLIFKLPEKRACALLANHKNYEGFIDSTYEVQIRTIFSEGWHEIEHDLRYKRQDSWRNHKDLSRMLNGINASLVASEWSLERIFDDLAHRFYKSGEWESMLKNKMRLRFDGCSLSKELEDIFSKEPDIAKIFFRMEKENVIKAKADHSISFPMDLDNVIFFYNAISVKNKNIIDITPRVMLDDFASHGINY